MSTVDFLFYFLFKLIIQSTHIYIICLPTLKNKSFLLFCIKKEEHNTKLHSYFKSF